jgi:endonuclease YncB( thermonuclease family)
MRQNQRPGVASVVCLLAVMSVFLGAQADPAVGTWKLNTAKSKYVPGPLPKANVIVITAAGSGLHVVAKGEDAAGKPTGIDYTATFDGKDVTVKGAPAYDTTSLKRVDANTTEQTRKKEGKTVQTATRKISADGKTMTVTTRGKDESGRTLNTVAVYDRQ